MADTKLSDLTELSEAADDDLVYVVDTSGPADRKMQVSNLLSRHYGSISVTGGVTPQAIPATTWTKITQFTAEYSGPGTTASHASDYLQLTNTGYYMVTLQASWLADAARNLDVAIYWNGALYRKCTVTIGVFYMNVTFPVLLNASLATKNLEVYVYASDAVNLTITEAQLMAVQISS